MTNQIKESTVESLRARIAELEEALKPFAEWAAIIDDALVSGDIKSAELYPISVQETDLRRAREVLNKSELSAKS